MADAPTAFESSIAISPDDQARERARTRTERHPFLSPGLIRSTLPFGIVLAAAFVLVPLAGGSELDVLAATLAAILAGMLIVASFLGPWHRLPAWTRMLPPLGLLIVVALLREATGEGRSGFAALVLIVPVWAALYEGRKSVVAAIVGVALTLIIPIVVIGAPEYPPGEQLREAAIIIGFSVFIGFAVQRLVQDAHDRASEARRSRRFLLAAMSSAVEGFVALDSDGRIVFANPSAQRILGFAEEEMIGADFHDLTQHSTAAGEPNPREGSPLAETLRTGEARQIRGEVMWRADGSSFPVVYRCAAFIDPGSDLEGAVVSFVDVAEQVRVERLKDELLSIVGHELRTPLTSIRGSLGLIEEDSSSGLSPQAERMIEIAINNTDRLSRLINDILDLERIESGKVQLTRSLCDVRDLIGTALETLTAQADAAGVELESHPVAATLWADPDRILQVLMNLISNAIKFSPAGSVVTVSAFEEDGQVRFEVVDRGRGIPAAKIDTVFERFGQVDVSDSRDKGGTGLGLPISRTLVHQHGGRIWIDSELGAGTTISFTIPALSDVEASQQPAVDGPLALVVEDDRGTAAEIESALKQGGLGVWKASDGAQAVRLLSARAPQLIVVDLALPDADGSELVHWMRDQPQLADVPLAVYTDRDLTEELRETLQLGRSLHFAKSQLRPEQFASRALELAAVPAERSEPAPAARSAHTVLIVDDEPDIREVAQLALETFSGWRALTAGSGAEAIEIALEEEPDVVLLDAMMPDLDGPATLIALRERERAEGRPEVPVVMLTAKTQGFTPERVEEIGARGLVSKPFDPARLGRQVSDLLGWD